MSCHYAVSNVTGDRLNTWSVSQAVYFEMLNTVRRGGLGGGGVKETIRKNAERPVLKRVVVFTVCCSCSHLVLMNAMLCEVHYAQARYMGRFK